MSGVRIGSVAALAFALLAHGCGQFDQGEMCEVGYLECDFVCVDPVADPYNCGGCGIVCGEEQVCNRGSCESSRQEMTLDRAASRYGSGLDIDRAAADPDNLAPAGGSWCYGAGQAGRTNCGGTCVNIRTDRSHCGACQNACPAGMFCRSGSCTSECSAGLTNCGGMCVNLRTISRHCGACNRACASDEVCSDGECVLSCDMGLTDCDGSCVNARFDRENCGECGNTCADGDACVNSVCSSSCLGDQVNCDGICADLMTDLEHCGGCDESCRLNEICIHGTCEPSQGGPAG